MCKTFSMLTFLVILALTKLCREQWVEDHAKEKPPE